MNITSTNVTITAEKSTANATYKIEYVVVNEIFTRLIVTIYGAEESSEKIFIGQLTYEGNTLQSSFYQSVNYSLIMADFETILEEIKAKCSEEV